MSPVMDSFNLSKDDTNTNGQSVESSGEGEQVSANDYDPNLDVDGKEDEEKRVRAVVEKDGHAKSNLEEVIEVEEEEEEDVDDMFAIDTAEKKTRKVKKVSVCMQTYSVRQ